MVYLDILTIPAGGWALCTAVVGFATARQLGGGPLAVRSGAAAAGWIIGYAWMWFTKWVLASFVFGVDTVVDVIRFTTENRISGDNGSIDDGLAASIRANAAVWWSQPLAGLTVVGLVAAVLVTWRRRDRWTPPRRRWLDRVLLAAPALIPLIWFEIVRNHSQVHVWFTYRSIALSLGIVAASLVIALPRTSVDDDRPGVSALESERAGVDGG